MLKGFFNVPTPTNEPVYDYIPGSPEAEKLKAALDEAMASEKEISMTIGGQAVTTGNKVRLSPPANHKHTLGYFHKGGKEEVEQAIRAALNAKEDWEKMSWENRAAIFLRAAELMSGKYRYKLNAATMLGQSKSVYQAEIDAPCEIIDFLRFNVQYMADIYSQQPPVSPKGIWNKVEQRPLEGFIFALTPFNFTAIAGNLPTAPAMMGNTVVWKPANTQIYAASVLMEIFQEAGIPDGVINLVFVDGPDAGDIIFSHPKFAGLHFTGSTGVFQNLWKEIGNNIAVYEQYPRIVGETGGKDFVIAHESADAKEVATALVRGAFEYQGQKCSAASRCYIPSNLWEDVKNYMVEDLKTIKPGKPEDWAFYNAVIDEKSFDKIAGYIEHNKAESTMELVYGGGYDKSEGYFIEPTVFKTEDPKAKTMCEEIFGPVLTVYVYDPTNWHETLRLLDETSEYALTGAIFSRNRYAVDEATYALRNAAGNFYINDKPTGAVVGQQPFGGGRKSGTNDKAGAMINLLRWVSPRTIKENFHPPIDYRYPFMNK